MMLPKNKFPTIPFSFFIVLLLFLLQLLGTESHSFSRDCPKKVPGYPCQVFERQIHFHFKTNIQVDKCPNGGYWSECGLDKDGDPDTKTAYDLGCKQLVYEKVLVPFINSINFTHPNLNGIGIQPKGLISRD
jgi:hypothetical protein